MICWMFHDFDDGFPVIKINTTIHKKIVLSILFLIIEFDIFHRDLEICKIVLNSVIHYITD